MFYYILLAYSSFPPLITSSHENLMYYLEMNELVIYTFEVDYETFVTSLFVMIYTYYHFISRDKYLQ